MSPSKLDVEPLTTERWPDLERLFGKSGAYSGCWCMWWRITRAEFSRNGNAGNRKALRRLVDGGEEPGLLAYHQGVPVGWCSLGPRERFGSLERSRTLKRVDDTPVWSIVCFFVARSRRGQGVADRLLDAAAEWARSNGAGMLEAYPRAARGATLGPGAVYMGVPSLFERHGFEVVAEPPGSRVIMRRSLP